jgi:hypothetical protein
MAACLAFTSPDRKGGGIPGLLPRRLRLGLVALMPVRAVGRNIRADPVYSTECMASAGRSRPRWYCQKTQLPDPCRDFPKEDSRNSRLRRLKYHITRMSDHLGPRGRRGNLLTYGLCAHIPCTGNPNRPYFSDAGGIRFPPSTSYTCGIASA